METNPFRAARPVPRRDPTPASSPAPVRYVDACVRGKTWWVRAPLLLALAWIARPYLTEAWPRSIFSGITLGFHEMGHAFFSWSGSGLLTAAGGTIFQLAVPLGAAAYLLLRQRDPFGATVGTFWLGTALVEAGVYAADARAQELPLVSPFGPVDVLSHDWTVMLMRYGMLSRDQAVGGALRGAGVAVLAASLAAGAWVLWRMARADAGPDGSVATGRGTGAPR